VARNEGQARPDAGSFTIAVETDKYHCKFAVIFTAPHPGGIAAMPEGERTCLNHAERHLPGQKKPWQQELLQGQNKTGTIDQWVVAPADPLSGLGRPCYALPQQVPGPAHVDGGPSLPQHRTCGKSADFAMGLTAAWAERSFLRFRLPQFPQTTSSVS